MSAARSRGRSAKRKRGGPRWGRDALGVVLGAALLGVVALTTWWGGSRAPKAGPENARAVDAKPSRARKPRESPAERPAVAPSKDATAPANAVGVSPDSPWASREACLRLMDARRRARSARPPRARIGTWNVRWYPDGRPGRTAAASGTDIPWLACSIAALDVGVLAVQEFKTLPRAQEKTKELLAELDRLTDGHWQAAFDDCPSEATQHTGLLWNAAQVTATAFRTHGELNPHGEPCKDSLRPGYGAHFRFDNGVGTHLISVHYKSGPERRSYDLRRASFDAMEKALQKAQALVPGAEVIFAGDFNTMGCAKCSPRISEVDERRELGRLLARAGLSWASSDLDCSEYHGGDGTLLDGFALSAGARARAHAPAQVSGVCAALRCRDDVKTGPTAFQSTLSDHCPVVLELTKN